MILKRALILFVVMTASLAGWLYYKGILVSLNITYDIEVEKSEWPQEELDGLHDFLQPIINEVLSGYSIEALLKYTKTTDANAKENYSIAMNFFRSHYGYVVECPDAEAIYIKQLSLFSKAKYFWRLQSNCAFEKAKGTVNFEVYKSSEEWYLKSFGIM